MIRPNPVSVRILTADLHSPAPRRRAHALAVETATDSQRRLVGDRHTGPTVHSELRDPEVHFVWQCTHAPRHLQVVR